MRGASEKAHYKFVNKTKGTTLAEKASMALSFFKRLKGLLGTDNLPRGEGLFISPCNSIHMFGMRYPIDAVFIDEDLIVIGVVHSIKPGQTSRPYRKAHSCLELPAGTAKESDTETGDQLQSEQLDGER